MKTNIHIFLILLLSFASCTSENPNNPALYSIWEAKNFISIESMGYPKNENSKILLTFRESGTFELQLDVNRCGGSFTSGNNNQLKIESTACTEACCDSQFSMKLASMISRVTSYEIERNTLKLNVPQWGWINCELVK